jgi:hypothetical protein
LAAYESYIGQLQVNFVKIFVDKPNKLSRQTSVGCATCDACFQSEIRCSTLVFRTSKQQLNRAQLSSLCERRTKQSTSDAAVRYDAHRSFDTVVVDADGDATAFAMQAFLGLDFLLAAPLNRVTAYERCFENLSQSYIGNDICRKSIDNAGEFRVGICRGGTR